MIWGSVLVLVATSIMILADGGLVPNLVVQTLNIGGIYLCLSILYGTYYLVTEEYLIVKSGPFNNVIKLQDIKAVKRTNDIISSPALSLDRISIITKGKFTGIMVSPENKDMFLRDIGFDPETYTKIIK